MRRNRIRTQPSRVVSTPHDATQLRLTTGIATSAGLDFHQQVLCARRRTGLHFGVHSANEGRRCFPRCGSKRSVAFPSSTVRSRRCRSVEMARRAVRLCPVMGRDLWRVLECVRQPNATAESKAAWSCFVRHSNAPGGRVPPVADRSGVRSFKTQRRGSAGASPSVQTVALPV
jgi:hypothetical protein